MAIKGLSQREPASIVKTGSTTQRIANTDTTGFIAAEIYARVLVASGEADAE